MNDETDDTSPFKSGSAVQALKYQSDTEFEKQQALEIQNLIDYELGFSLVVQELIKYKKPLIGHNMFLDLLFLYQQFIDELPEEFEDFVDKFIGLFP